MVGVQTPHIIGLQLRKAEVTDLRPCRAQPLAIGSARKLRRHKRVMHHNQYLACCVLHIDLKPLRAGFAQVTEACQRVFRQHTARAAMTVDDGCAMRAAKPIRGHATRWPVA
jgi:hypothetical protein